MDSSCRRTAEAREAKVREEVIESAQQASVLQKADQAQRLRVATMRLGQPSPMSGGWGESSRPMRCM